MRTSSDVGREPLGPSVETIHFPNEINSGRERTTSALCAFDRRMDGGDSNFCIKLYRRGNGWRGQRVDRRVDPTSPPGRLSMSTDVREVGKRLLSIENSVDSPFSFASKSRFFLQKIIFYFLRKKFY